MGLKKHYKTRGYGPSGLVSVVFPPVILGPEMAAPNFMGAWHFLVLSAGKLPMPIKFLLLGGGGVVGFSGGGGVEVPILFLCARGFF